MDNKEFSTEHCTIKVTTNPGCRFSFDVTVSPEQTSKIYSQSCKKIGKEVSIPGFRKGKAPDSMVEKKFASHIDDEWRNKLLDFCFDEITTTKIYPLNQESLNKISIKSYSKEKGAEVHIEFESYPQVPDFDFSIIEATKNQPKEISDDDVNKEIERRRKEHGTWNIVKDRSIQEDDVATISIEYLEEEEPKEGYKDFPVEVNKEKIGVWLYNLILGTKIDDVVEGMSELEENATEEIKKSFKPTKCKISIKKIHERILPELDEEFFKKIHCTSKEDMAKKTRESLEIEGKQKIKNQLKDDISKSILEKCTFDLPKSEVEKERQKRIKDKIQKLNKQGLSKDDVIKMKDDIEKDVAHEIDDDLRMNYIYGSIIEKAKIEVSQEEINKELPQYELFFNAMYQDKVDPKTLVMRIKNNLLIEKIWEYLLKTVNIHE